MKVTVCQIDPRKEHLDNYLSGLARHVKVEKSDLRTVARNVFF